MSFSECKKRSLVIIPAFNEEKKIGEVTHFFDKISVAIIDVFGKLKTGDRIKIVSGEDSFEQDIESMQVDHNPVNEANSGDKVGLKLSKHTKPGAQLFLLK